METKTVVCIDVTINVCRKANQRKRRIKIKWGIFGFLLA